jgi:hypothetical protein
LVILVILVIFGYFHMGNCTDVVFCLQPFWGETFDVHLGGEEYDAGITTEELLLIMANDEDKERAVSDESWALATGLLRLHDPGAAPIVRQFTKQADPANHNAKSNRLQKWLGFSVVDESHGTKYEAKILDAKGTLHHFAHHFPTEWGAAAAHGAFILIRVLWGAIRLTSCFVQFLQRFWLEGWSFTARA